MSKRTVISIVSGKGGTGKTLLAAVLAEMLGNRGAATLVIDMDIFVRGLTSLLYFHKKEALRLISSEEICVSDFFVQKSRANNPNLKLGISRYRSFDVLPSVSHIDAMLNSSDIFPDTRQEAEEILDHILKRIPDDYDFVILDNRAGYDELIAATHTKSDMTIVVEEEDNIARITADDLVEQLKDSVKTPLFRVTNKARNIVREKDLDRNSKGVTHLGTIPFDIDVMNSFGASTFWRDISKTLYRVAVARVWNRLNQKMRLGYELPTKRVSPITPPSLEKYLLLLTLRDRVLFVYGILIALLGFTVAYLGIDSLGQIALDEPIELWSILFGLAGFTLALWSTTRLGRR
ncbi:MAG: AAA family ATPase [Ardenticatenaceae bacterium]